MNIEQLQHEIKIKRTILTNLIHTNLKNGYMGQLEYVEYYLELAILEKELARLLENIDVIQDS
jgi:hypothetical protein